MGSYYENEEECEKYIRRLNFSFGKARKRCLEEICGFKTRSADSFWMKRSTDEAFLPYVMMCRSDEFSDYTAKKLSDFIDRAVEGMDRADMVNEAYFLLHVCLFKESDSLMNAYAKAARNYSKLRKLKISWSDDIISGVSQPDFLYRRYLEETEYGCEDGFFSFLTDVMILTASNAIKRDGDSETFTEKIKRLFEDYPDVFPEAGFYAYFIKDTSAAYDRFSEYLTDPVTYPKIFWVLDGLSWENGRYLQGSPTAFTGPDNAKCHFVTEIKSLDNRWYDFLTIKIPEDTEKMTVCDPYFCMHFGNKFSSRIINLISHSDERIMGQCSGYFRKMAVLAGNAADFAGLLECGGIKNGSDLKELCLDIAKRISEGRQRYCYHTLFRFYKNFSTEDKLNALTAAAEYLAENDRSEALRSSRETFLEQCDKFAKGEPNIFSGEAPVQPR